MSDQGKSITSSNLASSSIENITGRVRISNLPTQTLVTTLPNETLNSSISSALHSTQTHLIKTDKINVAHGLTQISINGINYDINFVSHKNSLDTSITAEYMVKIIVDPLTIKTVNLADQLLSTKSKLVNLAKMMTFELPQEVKQLVIENNININQLKQLSTRSEGYLLPYAQLIDKKLILSNGLLVHIPSSVTLPSKKSDDTSQTTVLPSIHFYKQKWHLHLKPIISEIDIKLSLTDPNKTNETQAPQEKPLAIAKPDIARLYSHLIKPLENISIKQLTSSEERFNHLEPNDSKQTLTNQKMLAKSISSHDHPQTNSTLTNTESSKNTAANITKQSLMLTALNKAFGKAGSLPLDPESNRDVKYNLASQLTKLIPHINPARLFSLAEPSKIREELIGQLSLSAPFDIKSLPNSLLSNMNSVSILFHLLLGVKTGLFNTKSLNSKIKLSQETLHYFQALQKKMGSNNALLTMLEKAGTTETAGKLINNLSLYAQASSDIDGQSNWYFTLPYSLNRHQDNLEGHFTQETDDSNKPSRWALQLKFNLLEGPILIQAKVIDSRLNMTISVENTDQQKRIDKLLPPLITKLSQIGLTPDKVSTQESKIPASLLPGEHYLVKIKA